MQLLSAEKVKDEKNEADDLKRRRIQKLNEEETEATSRLNQTRVFVEEKIDALNKELAEIERSTDARRKDLKTEINALEERKREASKPIEEREKLVAACEMECRHHEIKLDSKEADLKAQREALVEKLENTVDRSAEMDERDQKLDLREKKIAEVETELRESTIRVQKEWSKFHAEVHAANESLTIREKDVVNGQKSNLDFKNELDAEKIRLENLDIAVRDKYKALEQAKKHLGIT